MKKIYLGFLACLLTTIIYAQDVNLEWAKSMGGSSYEYGNSIIADDFGNIYVTGFFEGTADFDPGEESFNLTSNGQWDIFIQKLDTNGNFIWAKSMGSSLDDEGTSVSVDAYGNVYLTGYFTYPVDFDPGENIYELTSNGNSDIFIQKLDADGNFIWAKSMGESSYDEGSSILIDDSGNVCLTGFFKGTVDFDPGEATLELTSNGDKDVFIQKLNSNGDLIWAKSVGGTSTDQGFSIADDVSGNLYIAGQYKGTVDFDPGAETLNLTSNGATDAFILKLDNSGNFIWSKSTGGTNSDLAYSIAADALGNLYATGIYTGTVDFDPNAGIFDLISNGIYDAYIQKIDSDGNFIWVKSMGGPSTDEGYSIATDVLGNVYAAGRFKGTADFDPGEETFNLSSNGQNDVFMAKLNGSGDFVWAKSIGGSDHDTGYSIATDANGNVYVTGYYIGTVDLDPGEGILNLISNGAADIFVQKFSQLVDGIDENNFFNGVSIFPNPNEGVVNIDLGKLKGVSIKVFNICGQLVEIIDPYKCENISFDIKGSSGMYFIEVISENKSATFKVIKE